VGAFLILGSRLEAAVGTGTGRFQGFGRAGVGTLIGDGSGGRSGVENGGGGVGMGTDVVLGDSL
jgi:hypothetical protein